MPAAPERAFFPQPFAAAGGRVITAPFQFTTTGDDHLRIVSVNSQNDVRVTVHWRRFDEHGEIKAARADHAPNTDRTTATQLVPFGVGALLNLTVTASAGSPLIGQTYVMIQLVRGLGVNAIVLGTLLAGYVTTTQHLAWPGSPIVSSTDGEPVTREITGTNPTAENEIVEQVPFGARWELVTFRAILTTSAVAGNRVPLLRLRSAAGATLGNYSPNAVMTASLSHAFNWGQTLPLANTLVSERQQAFPAKMILVTGGSVNTNTSGIAAGDDWAAPEYTVREWLEVA